MFKFIIPILVLSSIAYATPVKNLQDGPGCQLCTLVLTEAQVLLKQNATQAQILNFLENKLCSKLGPLAATCTTLVALEGPILIKDLATLSPQVLCARLKLCPSTSFQPKNVQLEKMGPSSGPVCQLCTVVLTAAQTLLEQNRTEDQIVNFLDTQLCSKLGGLSAICKQYVENYGKLIIYELTQKIDPSIICNRIGLCTVSIAVESKNIGDANCNLCKIVFTEIVTELKSNATEAQIIQQIEDKLCKPLGNLAGLCNLLVQNFGPSIINQLANGVDPAKVCQFIGLCPKSKMTPSELFQLPPVKIEISSVKQNPAVCTACKLLVQYLDAQLKTDKTEAAILNSLKNACNVLPQNLRPDCDSLVQTYGTYIIQFLIQYADPNTICPALKLC